MECTVRRQPNGQQLSFSLPHQTYSPTIYPITAIDGSTIVLYGHEHGLNTLRLYESGKTDGSKSGIEEFDEEEDINPRLEQWIDIGLDSAVTRIAIPSLKPNTSHTPDFLRNNLLVLFACADCSIRLITFPLALNTSDKRHGVKVSSLSNPACHQDFIASIALSWAQSEDDSDQSKTRSRSHDDHLQFTIASTSTTGGGLLAIHRISLKSHLDDHDENEPILVKRLLPSPLLGSTLAFSPATAKITKTPLLLLTSPARGLISIVALDDSSSASRRRRGEDVARTTEDTAAGLELRIVLSLYSPYHSTSIPTSRKTILDAKWISRGTGIVALFEDGQWGVWDIGDPVTKSTRSSNETKASALNSFKILGNPSTTTQSKKGTGQSAVGTIIPATPHTRKIRSAALFGNEAASSATKLGHRCSRGRITLCGEQSVDDTDDALILSYDENNLYLPTLKPYLDTNRSGNGMGGKPYEKRLQTLPSIQLGGEHQMCIYNRSVSSQKNSTGLLGAMNTRPDLLVVTDSRLILHNSTNSKSRLEYSTLKLPLRTFDSKETSFMSRMASGDILDVDAMDQILENMENTENEDNLTSPSKAHLTAMQMDEQPRLPTSRMSSSSKLMIEGQRSTARRKLFG